MNRHASSCGVPHGEAYSDHQHTYKMCLHVTLKGCRRSHNALFRRVRFSSPGQTSSHLTERHSLHYRLTERRSVRDCLHTECVFWSGCASDRGDTGVKWERRSVHRSPKMAYRRRFGRLCTLLRCKRLQSALFLTWANAASPHGKTHSAPSPYGRRILQLASRTKHPLHNLKLSKLRFT